MECPGCQRGHRTLGKESGWGFKGAGGKVSSFFTRTVLPKLDDLGKWAKGLDVADKVTDTAGTAGGTLDELDDIGQEIAERSGKGGQSSGAERSGQRGWSWGGWRE